MRVVACLLFALALVLQCAAQQTPVMRILHAYPAQVPLIPSALVRAVHSALFSVVPRRHARVQQRHPEGHLHAQLRQAMYALSLRTVDGICASSSIAGNAPTLAVGTSVQVIASHSAVAKSNVTIGQGSFTLAIAPAVPQSKTQAAIFVSADAPQSVPSSALPSLVLHWRSHLARSVHFERHSFCESYTAARLLVHSLSRRTLIFSPHSLQARSACRGSISSTAL